MTARAKLERSTEDDDISSKTEITVDDNDNDDLNEMLADSSEEDYDSDKLMSLPFQERLKLFQKIETAPDAPRKRPTPIHLPISEGSKPTADRSKSEISELMTEFEEIDQKIKSVTKILSKLIAKKENLKGKLDTLGAGVGTGRTTISARTAGRPSVFEFWAKFQPTPAGGALPTTNS